MKIWPNIVYLILGLILVVSLGNSMFVTNKFSYDPPFVQFLQIALFILGGFSLLMGCNFLETNKYTNISLIILFVAIILYVITIFMVFATPTLMGNLVIGSYFTVLAIPLIVLSISFCLFLFGLYLSIIKKFKD